MIISTAKNRIQALPFVVSLARTLCTATTGGEYKPLYRRLSALGGDPNGSVEDTMIGWLKEGRVVTEPEIMKIVKELRKYRNYNIALELTDWMEDKGLEITFSTHAVRLDLISKVKGIDVAERYFSSLSEPAKNQKTCGALLNNYCQEKMEDKAIALFKKLKELNFAFNSLCYNNIMSLYMKLGQPHKALIYYQEMKAANIAPDAVTFGLLINCYASVNDSMSLERVIDEMNEARVPLSWSIYCILASYYNSAGLYEKAESSLKKAEEVMNRRDRTPYHYLITLYAGAGNLAETMRVWQLLKASFPRMSNLSYYNFLHALKRLGEMDGMKRCFEEWEYVCHNYDVKVLNLVIDAYLRKGMIKEAELLREKGMEKGIGSDTRTLDLFTDYYLERGEMDLALKCLDVIDCSEKPCEWKPTKEKVNAFLSYFEEIKDVDRAEKFCHILKSLSCLNSEAYESLIRTYLAANRKDPSLRQRIKDDEIEVSSETEKLLDRVCEIN